MISGLKVQGIMRRNLFQTFTLAVLLGSLILLWNAAATAAQEEEPVVQLKSGSVRGGKRVSVFGLIMEQYLGLPYAAAPVGDLRFSPPQPVKPWEGVRGATQYGARCPQNEDSFPRNYTIGPINEDCLYINVYRAAKFKHVRLPVMVWFHGGGFYHGSSNEYLGVTCSYGAIIVTVNYRLGLLGFLNVPGSELKGNYGMLDQVAALKWVQENIASFGGIPSMVTIFGQGAGASSVAYHMLSSRSSGLFHKAILQSGAVTTPYTFFASKDQSYGQEIIKRLGCEGETEMLACLREKNVQDFLKASKINSFLELGETFPVVTVDGEFLTDEPRKLLEKGIVNKVPVMLGVNRNDGGVVPLNLIAEQLDKKVSQKVFKKLVEDTRFTTMKETELMKKAIVFQYTDHSRPKSKKNIEQQWQDLITDSWFTAPAVHMAKALAEADVPVRLYLFTHRASYSVYPESFGVANGDEFPYVFASPWSNIETMRAASTYTGVERALSTVFIRFWTGFATYGDPNKSNPSLVPLTVSNISWPPFTTEEQTYIAIDLQPRVESRLHADRVAFWEDFVPGLTKETGKDEL